MILLVQGPPASGKTTLASQLSKALNLPHISRDNLCEWMTDCIDDSSSELAQELTHLGYDLMFKLLGELSKGNGSFIMEGCINPESSGKRIKDLIKNSPQELVEIFLEAEQDVLVERYLKRSFSEQRHKAHGNESSRGKELKDHLNQVNYQPINISNHVIRINTSTNPSTTLGIALKFIKDLKLT